MNLITEILKNTVDVNLNSEKYKNLILENIEEYKGKIIDEIYPNNSWIKTESADYSIYQTIFFKSSFKFDLLTLQVYKCLISKIVSYTWNFNGYILHPFHQVYHEFKLVDISGSFVNYRCEKCNISGKKNIKNKNYHIEIEKNGIIYSCDELVIKNIIE